MELSLSTRWNAGRHRSGEEMIEEIRLLGFGRVELGFDLRLDLVPGVKKMVDQKIVTVGSVHNFCPLPVGAPVGHPELFTMASLDRRERESAIKHTSTTLRFAAEIGAKVAVVHAGYVDMPKITPELISMCKEGRQYDDKFEKRKMKLLMDRDKRAPRSIECLESSLEQLLPVAVDAGVKVALEILPFWEGIPSESEMEQLYGRFDNPMLCYWHDIGHGQIRQNLGFVGCRLWLERLKSRMAGMHIHDVAPPAQDHIMPPKGRVDFTAFKAYAESGIELVFEPAPGTPGEDITAGVEHISKAWNIADSGGKNK